MELDPNAVERALALHKQKLDGKATCTKCGESFPQDEMEYVHWYTKEGRKVKEHLCPECYDYWWLEWPHGQ